MPDEFPTLEAALGVSLLALAWRLGLLLRALKGAARSGQDRSARHAGRARSRAGRDLAIAAVLGGSLVYARAAQLAVSDAFYALGVLAFLLLLGSAFVQTRLRTLIERHRERSHADDATLQRRAGLKPATKCPECGEASPKPLDPSSELGQKLESLGVGGAFICGNCGHLEGRARSGTW